MRLLSMNKLSVKSISFLLLTTLILSACQLQDNDFVYQETRGLELLKQKKYAQAETIFQSTVLAQENKYREIKAANAGKVNKAEGQQAKRFATSLNYLALVFYHSGKYGQAEEVLEKAIDIYRQYFGKQNTFVANASGMLASSYFKQGKLLEAEGFFKEELELKKSLLKPDSLELALISNNLASIYQELGDDAEAEKYFLWALNLCKNAKPTEKELDQYADILNNLALFYEKKEFYGEALDTVNEALEIEARHKDNKAFIVDKVRSLLVLASIEKSTFELDAAEAHYEEALQLIDAKLNGRADLACEALEKHAGLLYSERKFKEAGPIYARCIKAAEAAHGTEHPHFAEALSAASQLEKHNGRLSEAEALLRRALVIQENTIGVDTAAFLSTVFRLATVLAEQNREKEADALYNEILPKLKQRLGPDHPFVADSLDNWSGFVEKNGNRERAKELREQARLLRRKMARSLYQ